MWQNWPVEDLKELVSYSRQRGVSLFLWKHSKELRTEEARQQFFQLCRQVGAAGVKIDFFDHEAKEIIDLYNVLLKETAENHLLVNFHGANKPTGESRTWPNELTREAVSGMESRNGQGRATARRNSALHALSRRSRGLHSGELRSTARRHHVGPSDRDSSRIHLSAPHLWNET